MERYIGKDATLEFSTNGKDWQVIGSVSAVGDPVEVAGGFSQAYMTRYDGPIKTFPAGSLTKSFPTKATLDEFLSSLGPLAHQAVSYGPDLLTLTWRTLKLFCADTDGEWFYAGGRYEVKRETQGHYLIRDDHGLMRSVDRQTMLAYGGRFELEE